MAFGLKHSLVAVAGIAVISGTAWWYQKSASSPANASSGAPKTAGADQKGGGSSAPPRLASVEVARVEVMPMQDDAAAVGTLKSRQNVVLRPEVAGRVAGLGFSDGARVRSGQVLVQLDDTLQRAEVKQATAQVSIAQANLKRNQELVTQNFVAQRVLDESAANLQVVQAQLALACARLGRMAVVAPFDGIVGLRSVNKGDYLKDGADLVNLEDIGSMQVDFRLPERYAGKIKAGQPVTLQIDAFPGRQFSAKVAAVDPNIDANGRSVGIRAMLPNTMGEPVALPNRQGPVASGSGAPAMLKKVEKSEGQRGAGPMGKGSATGVGADTNAATLPSLRDSMAQAGCSEEPSRSLTASTRSGAKAAVAGTGIKPSATGPAPLRPGMFARVTAVFGVRDKALVVPEEAIVPQGGRQFVIKVIKAADLPPAPVAAPTGSAPVAEPVALAPDTWVSLRQEVKLGVRRQGKVEVTEGLTEGQTIVVAGQQRLQKDGSPVKIIDSAKPAGALGAGGQGMTSAAPVNGSPTLPASAASR